MNSLSVVAHAPCISYLLIAAICVAIQPAYSTACCCHTQAGMRPHMCIKARYVKPLNWCIWRNSSKLTKQNMCCVSIQVLLCESAASFSPWPAPSTLCPLSSQPTAANVRTRWRCGSPQALTSETNGTRPRHGFWRRRARDAESTCLRPWLHKLRVIRNPQYGFSETQTKHPKFFFEIYTNS